MKKKVSLPVQIVIALIAGILVGLACYFTGAVSLASGYLKPFGDIFVNQVHRGPCCAVIHD